MFNRLQKVAAGILIACLTSTAPARADVDIAFVHVFDDALQDLISDFKSSNPTYASVPFNITAGSAGGLYNTINTALAGGGSGPYDIFLSVDASYPAQLRSSYPAKVSVPFQYAEGKLVLVSSNSSVNVSSGLPSNFASTAVCNETAGPYGTAALQVLNNTYGILPTDMRIIRWNGIGLVFTAIKNKTVNTGFVAKAQVCNGSGTITMSEIGGTSYLEYASGSGYTASVLYHTGVVISRTHTPLETAAIAAFVSYLDSAAAKAIIEDWCFAVPSSRTTATEALASIKPQTLKARASAEKPKR